MCELPAHPSGPSGLLLGSPQPVIPLPCVRAGAGPSPLTVSSAAPSPPPPPRPALCDLCRNTLLWTWPDRGLVHDLGDRCSGREALPRCGCGGGWKVHGTVHYPRLKFAEKLARHDFSHEVGSHFLRRAVAHVHPSLLDVISDREEFDVEVSRPLPGRPFAVHLELHRAYVVLA